MSSDHVHILVSAPPTLASSEIMRRLKGRAASYLFEEYPQRYCGRDFLGARVFLCDGGPDDRGDDQGVSGASL